MSTYGRGAFSGSDPCRMASPPARLTPDSSLRLVRCPDHQHRRPRRQGRRFLHGLPQRQCRYPPGRSSRPCPMAAPPTLPCRSSVAAATRNTSSSATRPPRTRRSPASRPAVQHVARRRHDIYRRSVVRDGVHDGYHGSRGRHEPGDQQPDHHQHHDLTWTAPGDDSSTGTATSYDIRYSHRPIDREQLGQRHAGHRRAEPRGRWHQPEHDRHGLSASTTYYFAMKTSDEVPNTSVLSNVASGTTAIAGDHGPGGDQQPGHQHPDQHQDHADLDGPRR